MFVQKFKNNIVCYWMASYWKQFDIVVPITDLSIYIYMKINYTNYISNIIMMGHSHWVLLHKNVIHVNIRVLQTMYLFNGFKKSFFSVGITFSYKSGNLHYVVVIYKIHIHTYCKELMNDKFNCRYFNQYTTNRNKQEIQCAYNMIKTIT